MWNADVFAKNALPLSVTVVSEYSMHWADVQRLSPVGKVSLH
jgi:hypothetical protein